MKLDAQQLKNLKNKEKITVLTCYDAMTAGILAEAGLDVILVGDSCANVFLGEKSTRSTNIKNMCYHVKAVRNGNKETHIIGDMDYKSCKTVHKAVKSAKKLLKAGADSVKFEGWRPKICKAFQEKGIPFVGHVGLLPQTAKKFKVQGKELSDADFILNSAKQLDQAGAFMIVAECVPKDLAQKLQSECSAPIIGIGAGNEVDGQVLVINDMLGFSEKVPKFVRKFANLHETILKATQNYIKEVKGSLFPNEKESFH